MKDEPKASKSGRWQFSLRTLMGLVAWVAVVAYSQANWGDVNVRIMGDIIAYSLLLYSTVAGVFRRGSGQAFWAGFAIASWSFLHLSGISDGRWAGGILFRWVHARVLYPYIMVMIGYLGGLLARYFYTTRADEK